VFLLLMWHNTAAAEVQARKQGGKENKQEKAGINGGPQHG
jgi:hypothetical protein